MSSSTPSTPETPLRTYHWDEISEKERTDLLARATARVFDPELRQSVLAVIEDVRANGDTAVVRALSEFDGCEITPDRLRVSSEEFEAAADSVPAEVTSALDLAIDHIRRFNERLLEGSSWTVELDPGLTVGERAGPIASAGLFVPSGKGSFPSTLTQLATPAVVAGVKKIAIAVPPVPGSGAVDPVVLVAADRLGIRDVFRVNGPAGIAALAFGTETIPQCVKVLGPGSPAVTATQIELQRYGTATVMLMGPSESLVIADDSADPHLLALDLLIEAEHGSDSAVLLVTDSEQLLAAVQQEVAEQLKELPEPRRGYAVSALGEMGGAVIVGDLDQAAAVANWYAPEHLQLAVSGEDALLAKLSDAGEILIGQSTPFAAANYVLGVPAALPTGRYARVTSGVTARTFTKYASVAATTPEALERLGEAIVTLAEHEGFPAHARAIRGRNTLDQ